MNKLLVQIEKVIMNSLFGYNIRKDIEFKHELRTERWMETKDAD